MTAEERAYRRGALQSLQFLIADGTDLAPQYVQALVSARDSEELRYLGNYMDEIRRDVQSHQVAAEQPRRCECRHENCGEVFEAYGKFNETVVCPACGRQQFPFYIEPTS